MHMLYPDHQIHTNEKYKKVYIFKQSEQIQESSPQFYNNTLHKHIKYLLSTTNNALISKDIITIIGFGTSGSGKTFNLIGMDSSGLHNKYSVFHGIIDDLKQYTGTHITIEVTQVYQNKLFIIKSACKIHINQILNTIKDCLSSWKQQQFSTHNSSRAHLIIKLILNGLEIRIIDTAGFETPDEERKHMETVAINQDMLAFKECIRAVADKQSFIPSRRRIITQLLFETKNIEHIKNHIFVIGAIDPNYDNDKMKMELNRSNPKHPKISIIHNTLNYLTMLGCASVITTRKPIDSDEKQKNILDGVKKKIDDIIDINAINNKSKVSNEIIKQINTIEPKFIDYVPKKPIEIKKDKPPYRLNREQALSKSKNNADVSFNSFNDDFNSFNDEVISIKRDINEIKDEKNQLNSKDMMQNIINNCINTNKLKPIDRYINNHEMLIKRMGKIDYKTQKVELLNILNDQQLLIINMQMIVLKQCNNILN